MNKKAQVIDLSSKFIQKLNPSRPAAEQIASSIKDNILDMSLVPGQIISESDIGHLFGASRTPVREAFSWLREQGLIVTYPSRGNYVAQLSIPQLKAAQFIRESLEVSVAELLCERGLASATIDEIEQNLASQQAFITSGRGAAFHRLDDDFHLALVDAVGHPHLSHLFQREKANLDRLRVLSLNSTEHLTLLLADHRNIFEAIHSGEKANARKSVRKHTRRVLDTLSDLFHEHRNYFDDNEA